MNRFGLLAFASFLAIAPSLAWAEDPAPSETPDPVAEESLNQAAEVKPAEEAPAVTPESAAAQTPAPAPVKEPVEEKAAAPAIHPVIQEKIIEQKIGQQTPITNITPAPEKELGTVIISSGVTSHVLPEIGVDSIGAPETPRHLGRSMWQNTDHGTAVRLIRGVPASLESPVLRDLAERLLVTAAEPPKKNQNEMAGQALIDQRLQALWNLGLWNDYATIVAAMPVARVTPGLMKRWALALAEAKQNAPACQKAEKGMILDSADLFWNKMLIFCQIANNDDAKAQLSYDLWREKNAAQDPDFNMLVEAALQNHHAAEDGGKAQKKLTLQSKSLSALHYLVAAQAGIVLPADLAEDDLAKAIAITQDNMPTPRMALPPVAPDKQVAMAEDLAKRGLIDGAALAASYAAYPFAKPESLRLIVKPDAKFTPPARHALNAQYLSQQKDAQHRAAAIDELWNAFPDETERKLMALSQAEWLQNVLPTQEWQWFAPTALRLSVLSGNYGASRAWLDVAILDDQAGAKLWPYLRLLRLVDSYSPRAKQLAEKWAALSLASSAKDVENRLGLLATLVPALGDRDEVFSRAILPTGLSAEMLKLDDRKSASPAWTAALTHAVQNNSRAEAVLLTIYGLGQAPLSHMSSPTLAQGVEALVKAGLPQDARQLAFEILVANGF